ncbi:hypothetical protein SUGI_1074420 [Cryptomeria japonica]|nr:hypothetical protein SUGI_1074420 [Cryptomeria japonica]
MVFLNIADYFGYAGDLCFNLRNLNPSSVEYNRYSLELQPREKSKKKAKSGGFESLGLSPPICRAVIRKGYRVPTPTQRKTMLLIMCGLYVAAMARTGSGETAAFLIPLLEKLKGHSPCTGVRALVLSLTRELALQTLKFCKELGRYVGNIQSFASKHLDFST